MNVRAIYKQAIAEAVENCADVDLLDLALKILLEAEQKPVEDNVVYLFRELEVAA